MLHIEGGSLIAFVIFSIPIVAIVGGVTAGIVRTLGQQRIMELAHRERIAAIERGVDPGKLPPLPTYVPARGIASGYMGGVYGSYSDYARHRTQGLLIGGLVCLFVGAALTVFLATINDGEARSAWAMGLIPAAVGVALLLGALITRPHDDSSSSSPSPPVA
ncbi:MAG: hypothetical protein ACRENS_03270 [Candidatus Eiseniibacteriota bacterium]